LSTSLSASSGFNSFLREFNTLSVSEMSSLLKSRYLESDERMDSEAKEDSLWKNSTLSLYYSFILLINYDEDKSNKINKGKPSIFRVEILSFNGTSSP